MGAPLPLHRGGVGSLARPPPRRLRRRSDRSGSGSRTAHRRSSRGARRASERVATRHARRRMPDGLSCPSVKQVCARSVFRRMAPGRSRSPPPRAESPSPPHRIRRSSRRRGACRVARRPGRTNRANPLHRPASGLARGPHRSRRSLATRRSSATVRMPCSVGPCAVARQQVPRSLAGPFALGSSAHLGPRALVGSVRCRPAPKGVAPARSEDLAARWTTAIPRRCVWTRTLASPPGGCSARFAPRPPLSRWDTPGDRSRARPRSGPSRSSAGVASSALPEGRTAVSFPPRRARRRRDGLATGLPCADRFRRPHPEVRSPAGVPSSARRQRGRPEGRPTHLCPPSPLGGASLPISRERPHHRLPVRPPGRAVRLGCDATLDRGRWRDRVLRTKGEPSFLCSVGPVRHATRRWCADRVVAPPPSLVPPKGRAPRRRARARRSRSLDTEVRGRLSRRRSRRVPLDDHLMGPKDRAPRSLARARPARRVAEAALLAGRWPAPRLLSEASTPVVPVGRLHEGCVRSAPPPGRGCALPEGSGVAALRTFPVVRPTGSPRSLSNCGVQVPEPSPVMIARTWRTRFEPPRPDDREGRRTGRTRGPNRARPLRLTASRPDSHPPERGWNSGLQGFSPPTSP